MTLKKAIKMLEDMIEFKKLAANVMLDDASESNVGDLARQAARLHDLEKERLQDILKQLRSKKNDAKK